MKLSALLDKVVVQKMFHTVYGQMVTTHEVEIGSIQYDSRKVVHNSLFIAMKGQHNDGHQFIPDAIARGAKVIVVEKDDVLPDAYFMHSGVVKIVVENSRRVLATIANNFYMHPSRRLFLVGVTGTNGKTTTAFLIKQLLEKFGKKVGLIGTIFYDDGKEQIDATHTTPESLELAQLFSRMCDNGCTAAVMEVSSHALALDRVYGLDFDCAVFTNLTQDHLDFHHSMYEYYRAKKVLFDSLKAEAIAVSNIDDLYGRKILELTSAKKIYYGISFDAEVKATDLTLTTTATNFSVDTISFSSHLIGKFNVENILAAIALMKGMGYELKDIADSVSALSSVPGRFQQFRSSHGWTAIIDYAHTPDALEKILLATRAMLSQNARGKIITVFGAGGDRDTTKRPLMGKVASALSDVVILTSDNPRSEMAEKIIQDIAAGIPSSTDLFIEVNRCDAIQLGLTMAKQNDVIVIAGKGHEEYQIIGKEKYHFSDKEEVENFIRKNA
jgi:UDP-N-acetylmuramoyl-L-alanyl-D-glutamate--2,6-diaminopimelate ligase